MESRLAVLAATLTIVGAGRIAAADNKKGLARELFELGIEEYKGKQYAAAAASMSKSYDLDPQPDALYALAQAERLAGNCKDAKVHYQKVLDTAKDDKSSEAVKANLELCAQIERGEKPKEDPDKDAKAVERRDAPTIQIRTVYRTEQKSDTLAIAMFAVGGVALGGSVTTYLMARSSRSDADHAQSLAEYNDLFDRAQRLRYVSYAAAGTGVVLVGWATYRVITHSGSRTRVPEVAVGPLPGGGSMVSWSGRW